MTSTAASAPSTGLDWVHQLDRHAFAKPDATAIRYQGESLTWRELSDRSRRLAAALHGIGVRRGDRVIMMLTNRPEFAESLLAINTLGAIAVPINFRLAAPEVRYLVQDSGSHVVIAEQSTAGLIAEVQAASDTTLTVIVAGAAPGPAAIAYEEAIAAHAPSTETGPDRPDNLAMIMYTSGTTGRPKGAMMTYQNFIAQSLTWAIADDERIGDEIELLTPPLFHIAGIASLLPGFINGSMTAILPSGNFDAAELLDLLERERVTKVFLVPTLWQAVCAQPGIAERDLQLRTVRWGASPATPATLRAMAETFPDAKIVSTFGQTEMSPVVTMLSGRDALRKLGSVGKPVPLVSLRIVDEAMNDVPRGEVGEAVYRGPGTMIGYWNNEEATDKAFAGDWFHSGDLVRQDDEGFVYVVDRVKDMIISGGENIYSSEVENAIADHRQVYEVAVVGMPHEKWVETPVAFVVPQDADNPPSAEEIIAFCAERIASYKKPSAVYFVDALPRNASGKVLKSPLRERAAATSTTHDTR
ncbi:long-chain-fatty-acid--CoA ligase [Cumulibacter soli]|uniref:long-chain-fatty-acid--CoA ligase n=1 Tax=Cumulibacter soli TaxID=2546344 RepID=UPI00106838B6|nr:long-chain-fatty-acid--CoA ligase [Cumulibacter soli]